MHRFSPATIFVCNRYRWDKRVFLAKCLKNSSPLPRLPYPRVYTLEDSTSGWIGRKRDCHVAQHARVLPRITRTPNGARYTRTAPRTRKEKKNGCGIAGIQHKYKKRTQGKWGNNSPPAPTPSRWHQRGSISIVQLQAMHLYGRQDTYIPGYSHHS